jgi:hypothetical protein
VAQKDINMTQRQTKAGVPQAVQDLQAIYGAPSQAGFGSAVFHDPLAADAGLEVLSLAKYKYFAGDLWQRYGESAWMKPWKEVYARAGGSEPDIDNELRSLNDRAARQSVEMMLDEIENPDKAREALSAIYDDPAITELRAYTLGDDAQMSGLLLAGRGHGAATILIFLID